VPERIVLISSGELFHRTDLRRVAPRRLTKPIDTFSELREGSLVVHVGHGIARYRGMTLLEKEQQVEEHLVLEFQDEVKLYVPSSKIHLVQKYVGGTRARPRLAKLGGRLWSRQKQMVEEAVTDLAADMLELQAVRASRPGIGFPPDTEWQREFDASFPYQETEDQLVTLESIKRDMTESRPMDRLICGDVGFGKTEVAMRAAFKAVDAGYQVAVLVPTTVLAEQHFRTFSERMAEFPFEIATLSRFAARKQQAEIIERLAAGSIDIVIGTHRLAQADVRIRNLGLVVIDEEQRFGVEIKERLKALRQSVDVLTMTATPIPRTLHMALLGLRDISNLQTPPEDRLAVETRVSRFDSELIRHAVLRELNRDGQVFFVHNRVNDIQIVATRLRQIVPEARLAVGHAQMPDDELERVMVDFLDRRYDVLLSTTIVESGLDIPNANTMFIDEADRYGLADLHQLRGRVGRYKHRAHCYLLVDPNKHITPNAARRLRAIEEFSELGAGFAVAMRDLEIRGAGNLLGTQQSGHIAMVGYELYCQLLEQAVAKLKHRPPQRSFEVDVDLPGEAYIPRSYVPGMREKIDLYRRLARASTDAELADFSAELQDRFGAIPSVVQRLLTLNAVRIAAQRWLIASIRLEDRYAVFGFTSAQLIQQLAAQHRGRLRVADDRSAYLPLEEKTMQPDEILGKVKALLQSA
jgi:transcription-repair coupling factor (superfamily II helicase)